MLRERGTSFNIFFKRLCQFHDGTIEIFRQILFLRLKFIKTVVSLLQFDHAHTTNHDDNIVTNGKSYLTDFDTSRPSFASLFLLHSHNKFFFGIAIKITFYMAIVQ